MRSLGGVLAYVKDSSYVAMCKTEIFLHNGTENIRSYGSLN